MSLVYLPNPESIPVGGVDTRIDCQSCEAACCRKGVALPLTKKEALALSEAGTELRKLPPESSPGCGFAGSILARRAYYLLESDCGKLTPDGQCSVWGSEGQPRACKKFLMGSCVCALMRLRAGAKD